MLRRARSLAHKTRGAVDDAVAFGRALTNAGGALQLPALLQELLHLRGTLPPHQRRLEGAPLVVAVRQRLAELEDEHHDLSMKLAAVKAPAAGFKTPDEHSEVFRLRHELNQAKSDANAATQAWREAEQKLAKLDAGVTVEDLRQVLLDEANGDAVVAACLEGDAPEHGDINVVDTVRELCAQLRRTVDGYMITPSPFKPAAPVVDVAAAAAAPPARVPECHDCGHTSSEHNDEGGRCGVGGCGCRRFIERMPVRFSVEHSLGGSHLGARTVEEAEASIVAMWGRLLEQKPAPKKLRAEIDGRAVVVVDGAVVDGAVVDAPQKKAKATQPALELETPIPTHKDRRAAEHRAALGVECPKCSTPINEACEKSGICCGERYALARSIAPLDEKITAPLSELETLTIGNFDSGLDVTWKAAESVACPTCSAPPTEKCKNWKGRGMAAHGDRVKRHHYHTVDVYTSRVAKTTTGGAV